MFKLSKLLLVPAIILLAGCSFAPFAEPTPTPAPTPTLSPTPRPTETATPSPTVSSSPTATESQGTLLVTVVNNRSYDFCEFYISPSGSEDWGENLLEPEFGFIITANSSYLEWIEPGTYDLLIRDCNGNVAAEKYDLTIPQNMTWTLRP